MGAEAEVAWSIVGTGSGAGLVVVDADRGGRELARRTMDRAGFAEEAVDPLRRWVWSDTPRWYRPLLEAGMRVSRCRDLRLGHAILRDAESVVDDDGLRAAIDWDRTPDVTPPGAATLFDLDAVESLPDDVDAALDEFRRQLSAVSSSTSPERLELLLAAESAGALIAEEMRSAGLPWDAVAHDRILRDVLGERPPGGGMPAGMADTAARVRAALGDPTASLDSQPKLLRSLHRAGILVESTSRWELAEHDHPAIAPLLEYKKLARLLTANGWAWLDEWVHDGRFRPVYVPAGVVTGRWASSGGGALQLPRQLRAAVRADPGWTFVIADVAQLEPRVLAAMASDPSMARAARGRDLYEGIVESGAVATRAEAKIAILGAMYGATTGESGRLVPRLRHTYPRAMALVDQAAHSGEEGGLVSTWLGRTSPPAGAGWRAVQAQAGEDQAADADRTRARRSARDRGRFTRNFVVQGTAAEWALCWLAGIRRGLAEAPRASVEASRSGAAFASTPHLAFFLHDEIIVHTPEEHATVVADIVRDAAAEAGRLLFGSFPVDFRLDLRITPSAEKT